jgi:hypothetical protein
MIIVKRPQGKQLWFNLFNAEAGRVGSPFVTRNHMFNIKVAFLFLTCCALAVAQDSTQATVPSTPARSRMIHISAGVLAGIVDHVERPEYPKEALNSRIQGNVILKVVSDEAGEAILSSPVEGDLSWWPQARMRFGVFIFARTY